MSRRHYPRKGQRPNPLPDVSVCSCGMFFVRPNGLKVHLGWMNRVAR